MDNRELLASIGITQTEWGRLTGAAPRTLLRYFHPGCKEPALVHILLRFFVAFPRVFRLFVKFRKEENHE